MSTSSGNETPSLGSGSTKQVIDVNWDDFASQVREIDRAEFAVWLDEELIKMEGELEQFVTSQSRLAGRR